MLIFLLELKDICILFYILGQYLSHEISCTTKSRRRIFFYLGKETKKSPMSLSKERIELYSVDEVCSRRTIKTELIMCMSNLNNFFTDPLNRLKGKKKRTGFNYNMRILYVEILFRQDRGGVVKSVSK